MAAICSWVYGMEGPELAQQVCRKQAVVLAALVGDLADGPVGTAVVSDTERGALALCDGAEVDLLQLVQRGSRQQLGLLRGGGLCVCLLGSEGRGGLIAHVVSPF